MDVNYELYKVFYFVATTLSFSEASKQLFISQSAVSQSIKALEKKLDQTLFIRSTKRVRLTPEGEILLRHVEPAMNLIKRGEAQLMETNSKGGQIRIGASDTICRYFLVPYLERFHKEFPGAHIKVTNATSIRCVELLESGQVDLIVVNYPNPYLGNITGKIAKISVKPNIASAKISGIKTKVYTGKKIGQKPVIKIGKKTLKLNKDYKLSYRDNLKAGKAYVTITGINTYAGSVKKGFIIKPKKGTISKASTKSKSVTLTIKSQKSSGVLKYHVAYKVKDSNTYYKYVTTEDLKYTIKKLKKNKIYSFRVRGRIDVGSKVYYGDWSKIKNVKVK